MTTPDPNQADRYDNQRQLDELLAGYVLGDLDENERQRLRETLASAPHLQDQIDELRITLELLPMALPGDPTPPAGLSRRLLAETSDCFNPPTVKHLWAWLPKPAQLGMATMTSVLVILCAQVVKLTGEMASLRQAAPATTERILMLRGTKYHTDIFGKVVVRPRKSSNLLIVHGLPVAPHTHTYRLWANVNGRTRGCVRFIPNTDGSVVMPIPSQPSSKAQSLSITLEPLHPDGSTPEGHQLLTSV